MATEDDLTALLRAHCPRSYPSHAPAGTAQPYVVWTHIGGKPLRALDGSPGDIRNSDIQITVWDDNTKRAYDLIRAIEDDLCQAGPALIASPIAEPIDAFDELFQVYGALQRFSIWGAR